MKTIFLGVVGVCLALAGCGGASDEGGREENSTRTKPKDDGDAGAKGGKSDDDGDDDSADDDDDDDADDDTSGDDDDGDDDTSGDDDGVSDDDVLGDDDVVGDDDQPAPDPDTCEPVGQSVGPGYCQFQEICGNQYTYTYCNDQGTGAWFCSCGGNYTSTSFELTGVDQNSACTTVKDLCNEGIAVEFTGEPVCMPSFQSAGPDYCNSGETCTQSVPVRDGVNAVLQTGSSTSCYRYDGDTVQCQCNGNGTYLNYSLAGVEVTSACQANLCNDEGGVEFGEPMCTTTYESANTTYCEIQRECARTATLPDGTSVDVTQPEYTYCGSSSAGMARCNCSSSLRNLQFDVPADSAGTACGPAGSICQTDEEIVPEGPITCSTASQSAGQGYCDASIDCAQEAVVAGTTISVHGNMYTYCQPNGEEWQCQCQSNVASTNLSVTAGTAWDACTEAAVACPDLVGIEIDPNGGGYGYPGIPIPGRPIPL